MALTKTVAPDKIEVLELGQVQIRTATVVKEDGVVLGKTFSRHTIEPSTKTDGSWADTDISGEAANVQAIATAAWTDAVKTAWQEMVDAG